MTRPVTSHVYKRATEPGLPAGMIYTQPIEYIINSYIWWRLHCHILIDFWYDERGTSQNLSSFHSHSSWIYMEIMTQNVNFPIWPVQYFACQNTQRMYKVTLIVNKVHTVKTFPTNRTCTCRVRLAHLVCCYVSLMVWVLS